MRPHSTVEENERVKDIVLLKMARWTPSSASAYGFLEENEEA
jgi:hypothetical protein